MHKLKTAGRGVYIQLWKNCSTVFLRKCEHNKELIDMAHPHGDEAQFIFVKRIVK